MADIFDLFKKIAKKEEAPLSPISWIVVGLGNPGKKYFNTRHNAGFLCLDYIAEKENIRIDRSKFHSLCGEGQIAGQRVLLLKPQTFMNHSGTAVKEVMEFYKIDPSHLIVISDDIAQKPGKIRIRAKGSSGGQKGLGDIIYQLGLDHKELALFYIVHAELGDYLSQLVREVGEYYLLAVGADVKGRAVRKVKADYRIFASVDKVNYHGLAVSYEHRRKTRGLLDHRNDGRSI